MKTMFLSVVLVFAAQAMAAIQFDAGGLPNAEVGTLYDFQLQVSGEEGPVTFTKIGGSLPDGLSLSADGKIFGTIAVPLGPPLGSSVSPNNQDGSRSYQFDVVAGDGVSIAQRGYVLTIWPAGAFRQEPSEQDTGKCSAAPTTGVGAAALAALLFLARRKRSFAIRE